jgi:hypothetical protein
MLFHNSNIAFVAVNDVEGFIDTQLCGASWQLALPLTIAFSLCPSAAAPLASPDV